MRKIIIDHIPRYESLYFNCYNARMVSYLKQLQLPVEWLFYRSFEDIGQALRQCVEQQKTRWNYEPASNITRDDLMKLGVQVRVRSYATAQETIDQMKRKIDEQTLIMLFTNLRYLEHRKNTVEADHAVFVVGYDFEATPPCFILLDDNEVGLGDYQMYAFEMDGLRRSIEENPRFYYFTFARFDEQAARTYFQASASAWIAKIHNNVEDLRTTLRQLGFAGHDEHPKINRIIEALIILSGSRSVYARYCRYSDTANEDLFRRLDESAKLFQVIRNTLYKYLITGVIDLNKIAGKLDALENNEEALIAFLKSRPHFYDHLQSLGGTEWIRA